MIIECEKLFDGDQTYNNVRLTIENEKVKSFEKGVVLERINQPDRFFSPYVIPGLFDGNARMLGYDEGPPEGRPFEPHQSFLNLLLYSGVTGIRDSGNTLEAMMYLKHLSEMGKSVKIFSSGPLLDGMPFTWQFSRIVENKKNAYEQIDKLAAEDVDFIRTYKNVEPGVMENIVNAASAKGLQVTASLGKITAMQACEAGVGVIEGLDCFIDQEWVQGKYQIATMNPVDRIRAWSYVNLNARSVQNLIETFLQKDVTVCPCILSARRRTNLDEAINDPYLDYMTMVMPYHRHLKSMRNPLGYSIGKRFLNKYLPVPILNREEKKEWEKGIHKMREMLYLLYENGVNLIVGSDSPTQSIAPGFGLVEEMQQWVLSGIPPIDVLKAATLNVARLSGHEQNVLITEGSCANFVFVAKDPIRDFRVLLSDEKEVMCRGNKIDRPNMKQMFIDKIRGEGI